VSRPLRTGPPAGRLVLLGVLVATVVLGLAGVPTARAQDGPTTGADEEALRLVDQTSWVGPEGTFTVRVAVPDLPAGAMVSGRLHGRVDTPTELDAALAGDQLGTVIWDVKARPAGEVAGPDGSLSVALAVTASSSEDPLVAPIRFPGVYPFEVVVTGTDDTTPRTLVTAMVRLGDTPGTAEAPLEVGVVVPLEADAVPALDGSPYLPDDDARGLTSTIAVLGDHPDLPLTLSPSAESLQLLAQRGSTEEDLVAGLAPGPPRQLLAGPYARVDTGDWVRSGLSEGLADQYDAGSASLLRLLGAVPDGRIAVLDRTATGDAVRRLVGLGAQSTVVPTDQLTPLGTTSATEAFASGFDLLLPEGSTVPAVAADAGAATRLAAGDDPVLSAHGALAELAVRQLAQTGAGNGIALVVPPSTDPETLDALLGALGELDGATSGSIGAPLLRPTTVGELVRAIEPADDTSGGRTTTLVRGYVADEPTPLGTYPAELRSSGQRLGGLRSLAPDAPAVTDPVARAVLASGDRSLEPPQRSAVLAWADRRVAATTDEVVVAPDQVVTLTSSSGEVPLNLENRLPVPVQVRIVMSSAKLVFPEGAVIQRTLDAATTTPILLPVETRATGAFPLDVTISSADGSLPVASSRYTVRSTAISGVGLVLSVGAGAFLLVWWARHFRTARRARKLVGSDHLAVSGEGPGGYAPPDTDPREGR
jgi:hypothetical protein